MTTPAIQPRQDGFRLKHADRPGLRRRLDRLRRRFLKNGFSGFAESEAVELLLSLAAPRADLRRTAEALLRRFGNLREVLDAPAVRLESVEGMGPEAAASLAIIREAAVLYLQTASEGRDALLEPERLIDFWRMRIGALSREVFAVAYLDSGRRLLPDGVEILQEGTVDRAAVYPRRVVEAALKYEAAALVLAHNHPNGRVEPTEYDKAATRAVVLAGETVGLRVVDHLIVSPRDCFSFREAGLL